MFKTNLINTIIIIAVVVVVVALIIAACNPKNQGIRKFLMYVLMILLILSAIFSLTKINIYYKTEGGIYGKFSTIFTTNKVTTSTESLDFDFSNIVMSENADGTYSAKFTTEKIIKLDENEFYQIHVNNVPCLTTEYAKDYAIANYSYVFFENVSNALADDTLQLEFYFYGKYSEITITSKNGATTAGLWNSYFRKNGFVVSIKPTTQVYLSENIGDTQGFYSISLMVNNSLYKSIFLPYGSNYTLEAPELESKYYFNGWQNENGEFVTEISNISKSITLHAAIIDNSVEYVVNFYVEQAKDTFETEWVLVKTQNYHYGEQIKYMPTVPVEKSFSCWTSEATPYGQKFINGEVVSTCTGNMNVYAYFVKSSGSSF